MNKAEFLEIEVGFNKILKKLKKKYTELESENICCNEKERIMIEKLKTKIKTIELYKDLSDRDVIIVLIYMYYT